MQCIKRIQFKSAKWSKQYMVYGEMMILSEEFQDHFQEYCSDSVSYEL